MSGVIIGVDPHKASATIDSGGCVRSGFAVGSGADAITAGEPSRPGAAPTAQRPDESRREDAVPTRPSHNHVHGASVCT